MPVPDFILRLRERVGHDLLWLPGVTAVVCRGPEVLLVRRADDGGWAPVTGIVDPGEEPHLTAVREVLEETGVECVVDALAWVSVTDPVVYGNGDQAQYVDLTFRCHYRSGEARVADDESTDVRWFPAHALPSMSAHVRERVDTALTHAGAVRLGR